MSYFHHDEDEWETTFISTPCRSCQGDLRKCNGCCTGSGGISTTRRAPEDVARIKAARLLAEEEAILARADAIRAQRGAA